MNYSFLAFLEKRVAFLSAFSALLLIAAFSAPLQAFSSCTSGSVCDFAGQSCTQNFPSGCFNTITCGCSSTSTILYYLEPSFYDCFCLSTLKITSVFDGSNTSLDSIVYFDLSLSEDQKIFYEQKQKTILLQNCAFDGGSPAVCPPKVIDPPVDCRLFVSGPSLPNTLVATKTIYANPNRIYSSSMVIPASFLSTGGNYTASLDCATQLPAGSIECVSGCSAASAQIQFGAQACDTSVSVQPDKSQYSNGDLIQVTGTLQNAGAPLTGATVNLYLYSSTGSLLSSAIAVSNNGVYSASFSTANLGTGTYSIVSNSTYNGCATVSSTAFVSFFNCNVAVSASVPSQVAAGSQIQVSGTVTNNATEVPAKVKVTTTNGGAPLDSQEVMSGANGAFSLLLGPYFVGSYVANITAYYEQCQGKTSLNGFTVACDLVSSVQTDHSSYLAGDGVNVNGSIYRSGILAASNYTIIIRDSSGAVVAQRNGSTSTGVVAESFAGLSEGTYTATLQATSGECFSQSQSAQFSIGCDLNAQLVQTATCFSGDNDFFVVRVDNLLPVQNDVSINYTSPLRLTGPSFVQIPALQSRLFNFTVNDAGLTGQTVALINVAGGASSLCPRKVEVPICLPGTISIEAHPDRVVALAGTKACFPVLVRNKGADTVEVSLASAPIATTTNFSGYYNTNRIRLSAYEIRDDLKFCVDIPSGTTGIHAFNLNALSAINDGQDIATFEIQEPQNKFSTSYGGDCVSIGRDSMYPITINNNFALGDYSIDFLDPDGLGILSNPSMLVNFDKTTNRTIQLFFSPTQDNVSRNRYATMALKKDGVQVFQQQLCFFPGIFNASSATTSSLLPSNITAGCNTTSYSTLTVKNNYPETATYSISAPSSQFNVSFDTAYFSLPSGNQKPVQVRVVPKTLSAGSYSIPISTVYTVPSTTSAYTRIDYLTVYLPSACQAQSQDFGTVLSTIGGSVLSGTALTGTGPVTIVTATPPSSTPTPTAGSGNQTQTTGQGQQLQAQVAITASDFNYSTSTKQLNLSMAFSVKNTQAQGDLKITGSLIGLPSDWKVQIIPAYAVVSPGQSALFEATISGENVSTREFNMTFQAKDDSGKTLDYPFQVKTRDDFESFFSGLFVLTSAEASLLLFAVLLLFATGTFLLYKAGKNFEQARESQKRQSEHLQRHPHHMQEKQNQERRQ